MQSHSNQHLKPHILSHINKYICFINNYDPMLNDFGLIITDNKTLIGLFHQTKAIQMLKMRFTIICVYNIYILTNREQTYRILVISPMMINCIITAAPHPHHNLTPQTSIKKSKPCVGWVCKKARASKERAKEKEWKAHVKGLTC